MPSFSVTCKWICLLRLQRFSAVVCASNKVELHRYKKKSEILHWYSETLVRGAISFSGCHLFNDCDFYFAHYFLVRHESPGSDSQSCLSSCSAVIGGESVDLWWRVSLVWCVCCCSRLHAEQIHVWLMNIGICRPWLLTCCWSHL